MDSAQSAVFVSSPDGQLLAAASDGREIIIWRLSDGLSVQRLGYEGHVGSITAIAFSPNGSNLVSGSTDATAIVWSIASGKKIFHFVGHHQAVEHVAYATDGTRIVTASWDSSVKFWDARSGAPLCHFPFRQPIHELLSSPDGSRLAVRLDMSVALFGTASGEPIVRLAVFESPNRAKAHGVAFSPSGDRLVVLAVDDVGSGGRIYNTRDCTVATKLERFGELLSAAFSPDGG
ncbi:uncharacterized protein PHACADRAFT_248942, partial [Phanerochaete carnosa HHB-10118-sp]